jgi:hypothetical protein
VMICATYVDAAGLNDRIFSRDFYRQRRLIGKVAGEQTVVARIEVQDDKDGCREIARQTMQQRSKGTTRTSGAADHDHIMIGHVDSFLQLSRMARHLLQEGTRLLRVPQFSRLWVRRPGGGSTHCELQGVDKMRTVVGLVDERTAAKRLCQGLGGIAGQKDYGDTLIE